MLILFQYENYLLMASAGGISPDAGCIIIIIIIIFAGGGGIVSSISISSSSPAACICELM